MKSHSPRVLLEALHTISPDLPYDDWVRVGMAVHASALSGVQKGQPINPKKLARNGPALTPTVESVLER